MAKIWFVHEGPVPTPGRENAQYDRPIADFERLGLSRATYIRPLGGGVPKHELVSRLVEFGGGRICVVLEVEEDEAKSSVLRAGAGFYALRELVDKVDNILGKPNDPL